MPSQVFVSFPTVVDSQISVLHSHFLQSLMPLQMFAVFSVHSAADEKLGFEAAVTALGLKANISEAEHPLLCESIRRQRGELAIAMLVHYKDDIIKLSKVRPFSGASKYALVDRSCPKGDPRSQHGSCSPTERGKGHAV